MKKTKNAKPRGRPPTGRKPTKVIQVRVDYPTFDLLEAMARENFRTKNMEVLIALKERFAKLGKMPSANGPNPEPSNRPSPK